MTLRLLTLLCFASAVLVLTGRAQAVTVGSLSFNVSSESGVVQGLTDFQLQEKPLMPAGYVMRIELLADGVAYGRFTLIEAVSGESQAVVRLAPVGLPGTEVSCIFEPASRQVAGRGFTGFRYRYRVLTSEPGCEVVERTRWCLGGSSGTGTYFIRNVYGAQEYQLGGPQALTTYTWDEDKNPTVPHSRFGKMQAHDYHYIPGQGFMLTYFDEPALILNGKMSYTLGGVPEDRDQYFLAGPGMESPWKYVLARTSTQTLTTDQQLKDYAEVATWVDAYYRNLKGYRLPEPKPFLWLSPRLDRLRTMLPDIRDLGFKRIWIGPIWKSAATEDNTRTTMSVYDWDVADAWGGLQGLADFCEDAHKYGIEVIAWFPYVHLSDLSPVWTAHPEWRGHAIGVPYDGLLLPLDLSRADARDYVLQKLQVVRDAGLDGLWLDSYHNFAIESYRLEGGTRIPQVNEALDLQKQLQNMGFVLYIEGLSPYGLTCSAMKGDRFTNSYDGAEWRALNTGFHLEEKDRFNERGNSIGSDLTGVDYLKWLAWRGPLAVESKVLGDNVPWANFTAGELAMLRHLNGIYNASIDGMGTLDEVLPTNQGVRWRSANGWLLYAFEDTSISTTSGDVVFDLEDLSYHVAGTTLAVKKDHVYRQVATLPLFHDSFESGGFSSPQGAGAWWSVGGGVVADDVAPIDRSRSALLHDTDATGNRTLVAAVATTSGTGSYSLGFLTSVGHEGAAGNNNWVALRNGAGDIRVRLRWAGGKLQHGPAWTTFGSYEPGQVLHCKVFLDEAAGVYGIVVSNGASVFNVPVEGSAGAGVNRVAFSSGVIASSQVRWVVDNVTFAPSRVVFYDGFESGGITDAQGIGAAWTASGGVVVSADQPLSETCSVRILDENTSANENLVAAFPRTNGNDVYRVKFRARVTHTGSPNSNCVILRNGLADTRVQLRWHNGSLQHGPKWSSFGAYDSGETLNYEIILNAKTASYSIVVSNGAIVMDAPAQGLRFDGVDRVAFSSGVVASSQVDWMLDSVSLEGDTGVGNTFTGHEPAFTAVESWRRLNFGAWQNRAESHDLADPDGDGLPNVLEWSLDGDPAAADAYVSPSAVVAAGRLVFNFERNPVATDVVYHIEASSDLGIGGAWEAIAQKLPGMPWQATPGVTIQDDGFGSVAVVDAVEIGATQRRFLRLRITKP